MQKLSLFLILWKKFTNFTGQNFSYFHKLSFLNENNDSYVLSIIELNLVSSPETSMVIESDTTTSAPSFKGNGEFEI